MEGAEAETREGSRAAAMGRGHMAKSARWLLVGAMAFCGVVLLILAIGAWQEVVIVGNVPPELLARRVGYTVGTTFLGVVLIVGCLVAGFGWARSGSPEGSDRTAD